MQECERNMKAKPGFYGASNISIKSRDACLVVEVKKTEQIKKVGALKFHDNHLRLCFLRYFNLHQSGGLSWRYSLTTMTSNKNQNPQLQRQGMAKSLRRSKKISYTGSNKVNREGSAN